MKKYLGLIVAVGLYSNFVVSEAATTGTTTNQDITNAVRELIPAKVNALLQAWAVEDGSPAARPSMNFRLRRAELKLSGNVVKNTRWFVMADLGKAINPQQDSRILQDLGVGFTLFPGFEVLAGQFKTQASAEGLMSSSELLLPERSLPGRRFGDQREPGLMLSYENSGVRVATMASNGQGTNANAQRDTKDLTVRTDVTLNSNLKVGGFVLFGDFQYQNKGRWGVNTKVTVAQLIANLEYMMGRDFGTINQGFATDLSYGVTEEIRPIVRWEYFRPNVNTSLHSHATSLGVNYILGRHNAKLQAAVVFLNNMFGNNGTYEFANGSNATLGTLAFQMAI